MLYFIAFLLIVAIAIGLVAIVIGVKNMAGITDVNAALDQLSTSLGTQLTAIQTEIQQLVDAGSGATPAQLQALVDRIGTMKTGVDDTITQLASDDPPPPPGP